MKCRITLHAFSKVVCSKNYFMWKKSSCMFRDFFPFKCYDNGNLFLIAPNPTLLFIDVWFWFPSCKNITLKICWYSENNLWILLIFCLWKYIIILYTHFFCNFTYKLWLLHPLYTNCFNKGNLVETYWLKLEYISVKQNVSLSWNSIETSNKSLNLYTTHNIK